MILETQVRTWYVSLTGREYGSEQKMILGHNNCNDNKNKLFPRIFLWHFDSSMTSKGSRKEDNAHHCNELRTCVHRCYLGW